MNIIPTGVITIGVCEIHKSGCTAFNPKPITAVLTLPQKIQINVCINCYLTQISSKEWVASSGEDNTSPSSNLIKTVNSKLASTLEFRPISAYRLLFPIEIMKIRKPSNTLFGDVEFSDECIQGLIIASRKIYNAL